MCGIAGIAGSAPREVREAVVRKMAAALRHRGPDDEGIYSSDRHPVTLANRRLSIIDLPGGRQPIGNEDGTLWIVFNGEIYNYDRLRADLELRHRFKTRSDTEVILHLFEDKGPECLRDLIGMFALAIYNARDGSLFLARDRLGKKPLLYYRDESRLVFASELKAILQDPSIPVRLHRAALEYYLQLLYVPDPHTLLENIVKLPPGSWALWKDGTFEIREYWRPRPRPIREADRDAEIRRLVDESVRLRLVSDVPVACFLSGGIDSTIVTSIAASHVPGLHTIAVGFEESTHDEIPFARAVARRLGTRHTEIVVRPDAVDLAEKLAHAYDDPVGDSSSLPTYLLCQEAAKHAKVALSGDGGDECFAGYKRYVPMAHLALARKAPSSIATLAASILPWGRKPTRTLQRLVRMLRMLHAPAGAIYQQFVTFLTRDERRSIGLHGDDFDIEEILGEFPGDPVNAAEYADLRTYLPGDLLIKTDTASMAHSLEVRSPLLDHRLVEAALAIPAGVKIRGTSTKAYLRRLYADLIPAELRKRRKQGFAIPLQAWLKKDLKPLVDDALLTERPRLAEAVDIEGVRKLVTLHRRGKADYAEVIWAFMMLELWWRRFRPA